MYNCDVFNLTILNIYFLNYTRTRISACIVNKTRLAL